jgi:acyl-coenzyme A synthetase/AMP-(fatty) acid ligase
MKGRKYQLAPPAMASGSWCSMTGSSPCERGKIGSLYIGGVGLSPGYWNDPAKIEEVFHLSQPGADSSDRIYKTGDLARIGDDGLIYLVGRADSQVKIRGFRIELREIEAAVHAVSGVQDAAVVAVDSPATDGPVICCAFVAAPLWELSPLALKREVSRLLPHYMIPTNGMALPHMPRNQNGKTDRVRVKQWFLRDSEAGALSRNDRLRATPRCAG